MPDQILHERGTVRKTAGAPARPRLPRHSKYHGANCQAETQRTIWSTGYTHQGVSYTGVWERLPPPDRRGCGFLCLRFP